MNRVIVFSGAGASQKGVFCMAWCVLSLLILSSPAPQTIDEFSAENSRLKQAATDLTKRLDDANRQKTEAEAKYRDLATGKFIESGVTGGVSVMLQSELSAGREGIKQRTSEVTAMPYLMILPGFWANKPQIDKYCAGRFSQGSVEAQAAADELGLQQAEMQLKALLSAIEAGRDLGSTRILLKAEKLSNDTYALAVSYLNDLKATPPVAEVLEARRALLLRAVSSEMVGWIPGTPPLARYCFARKLGIWIGFPLNSFTARIESKAFQISTDTERDVRPVVSFGLGIAPNAIISGLFGVSYAIVKLPSDLMDPTETRPAGYWAFTAGIGGNLDLINLFRRR